MQLLTPSQCVPLLHDAGLVDLNVRWVKKQMDAGKLPYTVIANKRRIREDVLRRRIREWFEDAAKRK